MVQSKVGTKVESKVVTRDQSSDNTMAEKKVGR
jgi:hypothetical protein